MTWTFSTYRINEHGGADWVASSTRADTPQEALAVVAEEMPDRIPFDATYFVVPFDHNPNGKQALFRWVRPIEPKGRAVPVSLP